jgi:HK97 family phage prohead protease
MKKAFNQYELKSLNLGLKDIDTGKREVAFYLSKFDVIDSDNDLITRGAFTKSINERGPNSDSNRKIAFLRFHDWNMPIGKYLQLNEDENGLFAVGKLSKSTDGNNALIDYEEGIIREHSIGFKYMKDKIRFIEDETKENGGFYQVSEVQLFEGSAVTFGANEFTNVVEVAKSEDGKEGIIEKLSKEIDIVTKSIINGKGTDERLYNLEMKLKFLNSRLIELAKIEPFDKKHSINNKPTENTGFDWSKVAKSI